ncbi:MAG: hypothetical protein M3Y54_02625 [Bacteroidota bacterium]|nr:hypothetical protein [Bacteroidota bacterium]
MNDRHAARMLAFIFYCLDFPDAQIPGLVGGTATTVAHWKRTDDWDKYRAMLQRHCAAQGVPPWALNLVVGQADLKKQLAQLNTRLAVPLPPA